MGGWTPNPIKNRSQNLGGWKPNPISHTPKKGQTDERGPRWLVLGELHPTKGAAAQSPRPDRERHGGGSKIGTRNGALVNFKWSQQGERTFEWTAVLGIPQWKPKMGMGQNFPPPGIGPLTWSTYQGNPFVGYPILDPTAKWSLPRKFHPARWFSFIRKSPQIPKRRIPFELFLSGNVQVHSLSASKTALHSDRFIFGPMGTQASATWRWPFSDGRVASQSLQLPFGAVV